MNAAEALQVAAREQASGHACALVTVVRVEAPTSARPGDKAVVMPDGTIRGWVGGGCAQPAVVKTVRAALADGKPRLIRVAPADRHERDLADVLEFGMACHSGGTLELFIDPLLPKPQLVVIGTSPVAMALTQLGPSVGYDVIVAGQGAASRDFPAARVVLADDGSEGLRAAVAPGAQVVVATQGRRDLQGLKAALSLQADQISFVASARKAAVLKESLLGAGFDAAEVNAIVAPAGYPIAATTPEEIALSVLAAVVGHRRHRGEPAAPPESAPVAKVDHQAHEPPAMTAGDSCCGSGSASKQEPEPTESPAPQGGSCCGD